jgi:hypothetical protein
MKKKNKKEKNIQELLEAKQSAHNYCRHYLEGVIENIKTKIHNNIIKELKFFKEKNFNQSEKEFKKIIEIYPNEISSRFEPGMKELGYL